MSDDFDFAPAKSLAQAERDAILELTRFLNTEEGRAADDRTLRLWFVERGWPIQKYRAWSEQIAVHMAIASPTQNPEVLTQRLNIRLERLALTSEDRGDMKHAILATEAQAKLNKIGGFVPPTNQTNILHVTNANAHLVSDDELAKIAKRVQPENVRIEAPVYAIADDPLFQ